MEHPIHVNLRLLSGLDLILLSTFQNQMIARLQS